jgi:hypothetical protein
MSAKIAAWPGYWLPVFVSAGVLTASNALWIYTEVGWYFPYSLAVYLLAGSGLALVLLWRAAATGRVSAYDLGIDVWGWTAPRRLAWLAVTLFFGVGGFNSLQAPPLTARPTAGDYWFWFTFVLLPSSLAELLVFAGVAFCLPEQWLRRRGWPAWQAALLAALCSAVLFALYHFSHMPFFWGMIVWPLLPLFFATMVLFALTRNFYLTLLFHNVFAAVGFTAMQYDPRAGTARGFQQVEFGQPQIIASNLLAFVIPFLCLHVLEWRLQRRGTVGSG